MMFKVTTFVFSLLTVTNNLWVLYGLGVDSLKMDNKVSEKECQCDIQYTIVREKCLLL